MEAETREPFAMLGITKFGLIAEAEQGFFATGSLAGPRYRQDFVGSHRMGRTRANVLCESAISAPVPA
jgi:hypothetical protein